ncbi:MAG TPA: hypothetical protein VMV32_10745 [Ignavibacteriaceae bacterium]|nr:hypothetical protein [Ignavibacteriaceae bacterium]
MKRIIIIMLINMFLVAGCSYFGQRRKQVEMSTPFLKSLVVKAINGDTAADSSISDLVEMSLPVNKSYNDLEVDSSYTISGKKFFYVLLTYPNPIYNRFAIYNSNLKLLLMDKSLNGYAGTGILRLGNQMYISVNEDFKSKNIYEVNRLSLYEITDSTALLTFRDFTKLISPQNIYTQVISKISNDRILTNISSTKPSPISAKSDAFNYNYSEKKYISTQNVFSDFVVNFIKVSKDVSGVPEITDLKTALESVGIDPGVDTLKSTANTISDEGFSLTLTDNWRTLKDVGITSFLKRGVKGTEYINETIGASISVITIPLADSAEMLINYNLDKSTKGKYLVRYSGKIELKKDFVQFFEYTCGTKKYLLILQASKYTYEQYKDMFQNIINSFAINC